MHTYILGIALIIFIGFDNNYEPGYVALLYSHCHENEKTWSLFIMMVRIISKIMQEAFVTLAIVQYKLEAAVLNLNECHLYNFK